MSSLKYRAKYIMNFLKELCNFESFYALYYWPHMTPLWSLLGTPISRCGTILLHHKLSFGPNMNLRSSCFTKSYVEKKFLFMYVFCTKSAVMDTFCKRFSKSRLFLKSASLSDSGKVIGFFQYHPGGQPYLIFHLWWKPGT